MGKDGVHRMLVALVLLAHGPLTQGLLCYTCSSDMNNLYCANDAENSLVTDCERGENICCTIFRQEYLENPGQIVSFTRGCQPDCTKDAFIKNPDLTQMNYQTYCSTPKCNIGPGNKALSDGGGGGDDDHSIHGIPGDGVPPPSTCSLTLLIAAIALALVPRL